MLKLSMARIGALSLAAALGAGITSGQVFDPPRNGAPPAPHNPNREWIPQIQEMEDGTIFEIAELVQPIFPDDIRGIGDPADYADAPSNTIERLPGPDAPLYWRPGMEEPYAVHDDSAFGDAEATAPFTVIDSIGPNDLDPPDPDVAVGPNHVAVVTNDDFAVYDKCGNELFRSDIETFLGTPAEDLVFDPKVIYDPWNSRWVMLWHAREFNNEKGRIYLVISTGSTPWGVGSWYWYNFNAVQNAGTADASWPDYYDLGFSSGYITAGGNQFEFPDPVTGARPFRWGRLLAWDKADIYNQMPAGFLSFSNLTNPDGSACFAPRAAQGQTQIGNNDGIFMNSRNGGGDLVTIWRWQDAFGANTLTSADISVSTYTFPGSAVQPNGATLDTIGCRLMPLVLTNDNVNGNGVELFTSLTTSFNGESAVRIMKFDANTNAVELDFNFWATDWWYWFGCPAAGFGGDGYYVFCRTGPAAGREPELRWVDVQGNSVGSSAQIQDGTGSRNQCFDSGSPIECRWGDYFGAQLDWGDYNVNFNVPGRPAKAWLYGEHGEPGTWDTALAAVSVHSEGNVDSVTPTTQWTVSAGEGDFSSSSRVYTLTNNGEVGGAFEVLSLPSWLNASVTNGVLNPGTRTVTLSLDAAELNGLCGAQTLTDTVQFRDCYSGAVYNRTVQVNVLAADLQVNFVEAADGAYYPGEVLSVTTQVGNSGNESASYDLDIRASTNTAITTLDTQLLLSSSAAGAGGTTNSPRNMVLPFLPAGNYFIGTRVIRTTGCAELEVGFDATPITILNCAADVNADGTVSPADFTAWLGCFNNPASAPFCNRADVNGDGLLSPADFTAWLAAFNVGCN